jgi:hypothetical protein
MPIDVRSAEFQLLLRQFEKGNVVLFAGAGFSTGATNARESSPPLGRELAEFLAIECRWDYKGEDLPVVYEQAERHLGSEALHNLLFALYRDCHPADWHFIISRLFWYRIYSTNIDDVIENSYSRTPIQRLRSIICPAAYEDRDMWFESIQSVHLHGSVLDIGKGLTFTLTDFAQQTVSPSPWYQALVDDMYSNSFVFVGTRLTEPPFYHYLQLRSQRQRHAPENRAKAFVVSGEVGRIMERQLESQNMVVFSVSAQEFFETLEANVGGPLDRVELLKARYPHQIAALTSGAFQSQAHLLSQFDWVQSAPPSGNGRPTPLRTQFFLGAEPTWEDIRNRVDAEREQSERLLEVLNCDLDGVNVFILSGHAGSGKSTIMKRVAVELARAGRSVYFAKSPSAIDVDIVITFIGSLSGRRVLFFLDDAAHHIDSLVELRRRLPPESNVTLLIADRPHVLDQRLGDIRPQELFEMPNLTGADCGRILDKLDAFGFLGALQGRTRGEQLREFLGRSKKQLLVAMKEATSGRGFDVIIANEYYSLADDATRRTYLIACLCYMHGAPVRRRHLMASIEGTDVEKVSIIVRGLKEVLVPWKDSAEYLCPRHRVIARQVVREAAPMDAKRDAALTHLALVAGDVTPETISRRSPEYIGYRGIINFDNVRMMFGDNYDFVGAFYNELQPLYGWDFLFWLQWGRAEIHFDHFDIAENHLKQSIGIRDSGNFQAHHHMGVLFLKRACSETSSGPAADAARQGEDILRREIASRGGFDAYAAAALVVHKLRYLRKWNAPSLTEELEELYRIAKDGHERHPFDDAMREAYLEIYRAYLMRAVPQSRTE